MFTYLNLTPPLPSPASVFVKTSLYGLTSWQEHGVDADAVELVAACGAGDQMDWGLGVVVIFLSHCPVKNRPQALIGVLVSLDDDVHAVLEKQTLQAAHN